MSSLTAPVTLLSAVVATGASKAVQADAGQPAFLQVSGITSATVALQGSLDGTTYSTIEPSNERCQISSLCNTLLKGNVRFEYITGISC